MGVCSTEDEPHHKDRLSISKAQEDSKICDIENSNFNEKQKIPSFIFNNNNVEIALNSKKTIIKNIGQIKGESIIIKNNINCIILIMDYSYSVLIQNCQNCSIFVAPCETCIEVQNCNELNLISASLYLIIKNVKNSNFYSFVSDFPFIESSEKIYLGNFFVQYMELSEMFIKSKLNIWNNKWSCYKENGKNIDINYSNDNIKQNVVDIFMPIFPTYYINVDQFQFVPFTYGKSLLLEDNYINLLIILRQEDFPEMEILKMLLPEEIENYKVKLISTLKIVDKNYIIDNIIKKLEANKENNQENNKIINYILRIKINNNDGMESLQSSQVKNINQNNPSINSITRSRLNEYDISNNEYITNNNFKFLQKGDYLLLWFINENNDFGDIFDYFNSFFEPQYVGKIFKENLNYDNELSFKQNLEDIFWFQK